MTATTATTNAPADVQPIRKPGSANPQRALVLVVFIPIAAFLAFGITWSMDYPHDRYGMIGLALATIAVALMPIALDQARPAERRHLLLTFFCFLFMAHFALPIFTQYAVVSMPTNPPGVGGGAVMPHDIVRGQIVALVGLISFLIGYAALPMKTTDRDIARRSASDWSPGVIQTVAVLMLVMGWVVVITGALGWIPAAVGTGFINTLGSAVIYGNALLAMAALRYRSRAAWMMLAAAVPISSFLGFMTGSKKGTLVVPAVIVFTSMLLGGRLRARWIVVGILALSMLYPLAYFYRAEVLAGNTLTIVDALREPTYTFGIMSDFLSSSRGGQYMLEGLTSTAARLDAIGIESVIVRDTPSVSPFQNGRTLVLFFAAFVPRLFWPGKPEITIGHWITATYGSGAHVASHTGPSLIGDLYLNFGVPSVVIGMLVLGALLRLVQVRFLGPAPTAVGILMVMIVLIQVLIKQMGTVAHTLSSTVFALAPVYVAYLAVPFFVGRRRTVPMRQSESEEPDSPIEARTG